MKKTLFSVLTLFLFITVYAQTEGYVDNVDSKTYYRTYGAGKPVLIINGGPGMNSDGFVYLAKKLSANNKTIIYDQRGTGKSFLNQLDSSTVTMRLMAEDIERLRKQLRIEKWIVLGHSFGGMLAAYYATIYPEKIESLILSSSGGIDLGLLSYVNSSINSKLSSAELDSVAYWTKRINDGDTSYYAKLQRGKSLAPAYVYDRKNIPAIAERLTQTNNRVNELVWDDLQRIKFDCTSKLSGFNKPVLIIQGKQDVVDEKIALKEHKTLKNSTLILIDKCVHYGWLDAPDKYLPAVEKFITQK